MPPARRLPATRLTTLVAVALAALLTLTLPPAAHAQGGALRGPDVSSHQHPYGHSIDWGRAKTGGTDFAFVKATEGRSYTNPYFARDYASLAAHGIIRGAYHFARPGGGGTNARAQARYFVRTAGSLTGAGELPAVLDLETTGGLRPAALISWTRAYLREVQRLTGRQPIVYTYPSFWRTAMADTHAFTRYPLWIATYTGPAQLVGGWHRYLFWQHTDHASIPGIATAVDGNVFAGTRAQLLRLAHTVTAPAAPTRLTARPETAGSQKVDVTWRAAAAGGRPDTYRVRVDGRQAATVNAGTSGGTVAWSTRLAPGTHTIAVAAHNTAGLSAPAQTTVSVVVRPGPPTGLQVATAGLRLTAAWAPPVHDAGELTGYRVRLDDKAPVTLPATATSYTAKGLATGPHTLQVLAYNRIGESRAITRSATVVTKPGGPTHLSLSVADTTVTSRWDPPTSAGGELLGYHVRVDDGAPVTVPASTTQYAAAGLAAGPHTVTVTAYNRVGDSVAASAAATVIVTPTPPLGLRTALVAESLTVAWDPPAELGGELTGYLVGIDDAPPVKVPATSTTRTFDGLAPGAHRVTVAAYNSAGTSRAVATTVVVVIIPGAPTRVHATTSHGSATLTWRPPTDNGGELSGYLVWVDGGDAVPVPASMTTYTAAGLRAGPHVLEVAAYNAAGSSPPVAQRVNVVLPATPPTELRATVHPTRDSSGHPGSVTVTWHDPLDPGGALDGYRLRIDGHAAASLAPTATTYTTTALKPGRHTISVAAHNAAGSGAPATVKVGVPATPALTLAADAGHVRVGDRVTIHGTITGIGSGTEAGIRVCREQLAGSRWHAEGCTRPHAGRFSFVLEPRARGVLRTRVVVAATASHYAATSPTVRIRVR